MTRVHPTQTTFHSVRLEKTRPHRLWFFARRRTVGTLSTNALTGDAIFDCDNGGRAIISHVRSVHIGVPGVGSAWIVVQLNDDDAASTLYLHDGRWFGLRGLLPPANLRIAQALYTLVAPELT